MISVDELKERFSVRDLAGYGKCIVIPRDEFDPGWEHDLEEQRRRCIWTDLGTTPVVLVKVNRRPGRPKGLHKERVVKARPAGPEPQTPQPEPSSKPSSKGTRINKIILTIEVDGNNPAQRQAVIKFLGEL